MLTTLHIQDFVLIDTLRLTLGRGLTALTGETGAGKSILLEALGLAAGGRAARGAVRRGATSGSVTAAFDPPPVHPVWAMLDENGVATADGEVILRRVQNADGRGRAFINDQPASVALLRKIGACLIEIHGQHDGRGFLTASTHRALLDEFGGLEEDARQVRKAWRAREEARRALDDMQSSRDGELREMDYLRHVVEELTALAVRPAEEAELAARRTELMAQEKAADDLKSAEMVLGEDALEGRLAASARRLERAGAAFGDTENPVTDVLEKIERALSEVMEARAAVEMAVQRMEFRADELEAVEERLFALRAAGRKHGVPPGALPRVLTEAGAALQALERGAGDFDAQKRLVEEASSAYETAARALSAGRAEAARALDAAVARELEPLKLGRAVFETRLEPDATGGGVEGAEHVEFMAATNPGAPAGPLKVIASGGELSRFVLAMKAALAAKESRTVIIFDEVDAGVGGAVADAVGERLARLAADAQVLVVTHSPQVAARADAQWVVSKTHTEDETTTHVRELGADERVEEIARMLSGAEITKEARAAAARLLGAPKRKTSRKPREKPRVRKSA